MAHGYSVFFINDVHSANPRLLGVRLGKLCIKKQVSVIEVAKHFGVSRQTVYCWFRGVRQVTEQYKEKMEKLINKLS